MGVVPRTVKRLQHKVENEHEHEHEHEHENDRDHENNDEDLKEMDDDLGTSWMPSYSMVVGMKIKMTPER